jgi:16S rRNA processing protein RimM
MARMLVRFAGIDDRDHAAELTKGELLAERAALPDPGPGVMYTFQLIGLRVETEDGRALGTLADVMPTGAHPIYVVRGARELLVPATAETVRRVDLEAGVITVTLPAGLEEL